MSAETSHPCVYCGLDLDTLEGQWVRAHIVLHEDEER